MNIIGDVAGNYNTFRKLVAKMPKGRIVCVGDIVDQGPNSVLMIRFCMNLKDRITVIMGNHEHMMLDYYYQKSNPNYQPYYEIDTWLHQGGEATLNSLNKDWKTDPIEKTITPAIVKWLEALPTHLEFQKLLITHAPLLEGVSLSEANIKGPGFLVDEQKSKETTIWNRYEPGDYKGKRQIFGHNSSSGVKVYTKDHPRGILDTSKIKEAYGICIDTSSVKKLTGIHYPSLQLFEQEYID